MKSDTSLPTSSEHRTGTPSAAGPDATMLAITQTEYGSPDVLELTIVKLPEIADDEVLIDVVAAGLDRGTWHLMAGKPYLVRLIFGFSRPRNPVLGSDVSGRVVKVGAEVTRFSPGDEVFGIARGSFAEFAAAKESKLVLRPKRLTHEQAAVSAISGTTALQALTSVGKLEADQDVLVVGASGGVGSFAVQIAKSRGATVTGVARTEKLDFVRSLGADGVFDYTTGNITEIGRRFDLVVDIGGNNSLSKLRRLVRPEGALVFVGGEGGDALTGGMGMPLWASFISLFSRQRMAFFIAEEGQRFLAPLAGYLGEGLIVPAVGARYPLEQAPAAMEEMLAGRLKGKAVILVDQDSDGSVANSQEFAVREPVTQGEFAGIAIDVPA